jgi:hypothetical protein
MFPGSVKPTGDDVFDPRFLEWLKGRFGGTLEVKPDRRDYDRTVEPETAKEFADQYRSAQARKLKRMHADWKAERSAAETGS